MTDETQHPAEDRVGERLRRLLSEVEAENQRLIGSPEDAAENTPETQPASPDGNTLLLPE